MPTMDDIVAKLTAFGEKTVTGFDTINKSLAALRLEYEAGKAALEATTKRVDDLSSQMRERPAGATPNGKPVFAAEADAKGCIGIDGNKFSIVKALCASHDAKFRGDNAWDANKAGYEREALKAFYATRDMDFDKKTMTFGDESAGGFLIPPEVRATIDVLRTTTFLDQLPIQRYSGLTYAPVEFPRQTADETSYWIGEGATLTLSDQSYDMVKLNPNKLGCGTRISNTLLRKAPGVAEQRVRAGIAASMQRKFEKGVIEGLGASGEPLGVNNAAGISTESFSGATMATKLALLRKMVADILTANVSPEGMAWLMPEAIWQNILALQVQVSSATTGTNIGATVPLIGYAPQAVGAAPAQKMLCGYPVVTSTTLTASTTGTITLAKWPHVIVGDWGAAMLRLTTEGETLAKIDSSLVTGYMECDVQVEHPEAICTGTSYTYAITGS